MIEIIGVGILVIAIVTVFCLIYDDIKQDSRDDQAQERHHDVG